MHLDNDEAWALVNCWVNVGKTNKYRLSWSYSKAPYNPLQREVRLRATDLCRPHDNGPFYWDIKHRILVKDRA